MIAFVLDRRIVAINNLTNMILEVSRQKPRLFNWEETIQISEKFKGFY